MSQPVLFKWEVEAFLLEHLRFQKLTEEDFDELARRKIIPHPRGIQLVSQNENMYVVKAILLSILLVSR